MPKEESKQQTEEPAKEPTVDELAKQLADAKEETLTLRAHCGYWQQKAEDTQFLLNNLLEQRASQRAQAASRPKAPE